MLVKWSIWKVIKIRDIILKPIVSYLSQSQKLWAFGFIFLIILDSINIYLWMTARDPSELKPAFLPSRGIVRRTTDARLRLKNWGSVSILPWPATVRWRAVIKINRNQHPITIEKMCLQRNGEILKKRDWCYNSTLR